MPLVNLRDDAYTDGSGTSLEVFPFLYGLCPFLWDLRRNHHELECSLSARGANAPRGTSLYHHFYECCPLGPGYAFDERDSLESDLYQHEDGYGSFFQWVSFRLLA